MMRAGLMPGMGVPDFSVPLVGGGRWQLSRATPARFTLIDFYRGRHCPRCHLHILDLKSKLARFAERGVECIAVSMDDKDKAVSSMQDWGLEGLKLGHSLAEADARALGLYLTTAITEREPRLFSEPAIMLVRPDASLYSALYGTNPFARVHAADILEGLDVIIARDYPARGDVV
jgi:peroxiredoxin